MANILVAYMCWFFGGIFGLHHFYLGRDKHAFVWYVSGGGLVVGWLRDLLRLPEYVYEANGHPGFMSVFDAKRAWHPKPPFSVVRFAGELYIGLIFAFLFRCAIPEEVLKEGLLGYPLIVSLPVFGGALGVNLVGNVGHQKARFKWSLLGAALAIPWLLSEPQEVYMIFTDLRKAMFTDAEGGGEHHFSRSIVLVPLFSALATHCKSEWNTDKRNKKGKINFIKRVFVMIICGSIYMSLWGSALYSNASVTTRDGQRVPLRVAIHNFFQSPAWREMKKSIKDVFVSCVLNGWRQCYQEFVEKLDPTGESHAYRVLGFNTSSPTMKEIKTQCRQMGRKWHPDKVQGETEKATAQEKFIEVQKACEMLNDIHKKRTERNTENEYSEEDLFYTRDEF